jgi:dihydroorotase
MADVVLVNGQVVLPEGIFPTDILIENERITAIGDIGSFPNASTIIDAKGLTILPGIVDDHVHFRDPGLTEKEDISSGSKAAAAGGVTTILDMPNTIPPVSNVEVLHQKINRIHDRSYIDIGLYGVLAQDNLKNLADMAEAGAIGFKLFMGETTGYIHCPDDAILYQQFQEAARLGLRIGAHAENDALLQFLKSRMINLGRQDTRAHLESRPDSAEVEAISRGILLSQKAGNAFHVFHLSTERGLDHIREAKRQGLNITTEVLVGHLMFTDNDYERLGNQIRLNPPIRSARNQAALWGGLIHGWIDAIATDHAPHTRSEKTMQNVWDAACGFIGVETALPLMLTKVNQGLLSLHQYVRSACINPARIWGLYPRKGVIQIGSDADFVLVDMQKTTEISETRLHNKNPFTPYEGLTVRGIPRMTILRGTVIMQEGEITGLPQGKFLPSPISRRKASHHD